MNPQTHKQQAQQFLQQGRPDQAQALLEPLVKKAANDAEAWFLLGLARGQTANLTGAEQAFRRCVKLRADAFAAWDNLGLALLQQGKMEEVERAFRRSIKLNPANPIPHVGLGQLYRVRGELQKSVNELQAALRIDPQQANTHHQLALSLRAANQIPQAIDHIRKATELNPNAVEAWHTLGELSRSQTDFEGALNAFQRALQIHPQAETWFSLGLLMEELNRRSAAISSYRNALALQPELLPAYIRLGIVLRIDGDIDAARTQLDRALQINPGHPIAVAELAKLLAMQGHYQTALEQLRPLLKGKHTPIEVALAYAEISRPVKQEAEALALLEGIQNLGGVPADQEESFLFALAKLHEQAAHYEQAFDHYHRSHKLRPLPNDIEQHQADMHAIRTHFSRAHLAELPRSKQDSQRPVFIVGMPRSGTSLIEQILAAHPQVHGGGELPLIWQFVRELPETSGAQEPYPSCVDRLSQHALDTLAREYLDKLTSLDPQALRVTDKLPHNFVHLGLIEMLFPQARVIHCLRDPLDTCLSIWFHKFNTSHLYARDLYSLGRYYRAYEKQMAHWAAALTLPLMTLRYEELVEDVEGQSRRLVDFCELDWDDACLQFHTHERTVNTPSHAQVRQPIYRSAMQRWRHFEPWIGPLREGLALDQ